MVNNIDSFNRLVGSVYVMARVRSPARDKAFEIYKKNNGNIDLVEIAKIYHTELTDKQRFFTLYMLNV